MSKNSNSRVIIVGAGIGGLSLAIALRRQGHEPVVLERAPHLEAVGAGITLFPNAMSGLGSLGVAGAVSAAGAPSTHSAILTSDGRQLTTLPSKVLEGTVALHRMDLQAALLHAAADLGVDVEVGIEVTSIEQTGDDVRAKAADGSERRGELLVGADGVWSAARGSVAPSAPSYSGYTAWRGVSSAEIEPGHIIESWGVGERFGLVDIGSRTYWFATANTPEGDVDHPHERKRHLMRRFAHWHSDIPTILEATPDDSILRNDVYYLQPLPRWSQGRTVLLGDAAHATTP
jgi:2-polyprenyl-6-methoxyphenol hydroxylase-like FAD-dependent oxidoreductase